MADITWPPTKAIQIMCCRHIDVMDRQSTQSQGAFYNSATVPNLKKLLASPVKHQVIAAGSWQICASFAAMRQNSRDTPHFVSQRSSLGRFDTLPDRRWMSAYTCATTWIF